MSRRLIYNPADFADAATPFYENIIGIITDQTDRISRNVQLAREERMVEEDRVWQESQLQKQLDAKSTEAEENREFQADQTDKQLAQRNKEFMGQQQLGWAQLGQSQLTEAQRQADSELNEKQKHVDQSYAKIRDVGFIGSNSATRHIVDRGPDGNIYVFDNENKDGDGNPTPLGTYDQYVDYHKEILNFTDQFLDGQNVLTWAENNLTIGDTYEDAETGAEVIDRTKFLNIVNAYRSGMDTEFHKEKLSSIMNQDSDVRLLYKDADDLTVRDPVKVAATVGQALDIMGNANNYRDFLVEGDTSDAWAPEIADDPEQFVPFMFTREFQNIPGKEYKGQTFGQMEQRYLRMRDMTEGGTDEVRNIGKGISMMKDLAWDLVSHNPDAIPEHLRHIDRATLVNSLRVRGEEMSNPNPDLKSLFEWPETEDDARRRATPEQNENLYETRRETNRLRATQSYANAPNWDSELYKNSWFYKLRNKAE